MIAIVLTFLLSSTVFGEAPQWQKHYQQYFTPAIGEEAKFSEMFVGANYSKHHEPVGYIKVTVPKNECLTVTTMVESHYICGETKKIPFKMVEVTRKGVLGWHISNEEIMHAPISWPTPYRYGFYSKDVWPGPAEPFVIQSCSANKESRKITLTMMDNKKFFIQFPKQDVLIQPQPKEIPNLIVKKKAKGGFITGKVIDEGDKHSGATLLKPIQDYDWVLHPRGTFVMMGDQISSTGFTMPSGSTSRCIYNFEVKKYPGIGAVECREVGPYSWIRFNLTCMDSIKLLD